MPRHFKPDPYNGFKDDRERCRALNVRACCMALAVASFNPNMQEIVRLILGLFR